MFFSLNTFSTSKYIAKVISFSLIVPFPAPGSQPPCPASIIIIGGLTVGCDEEYSETILDGEELLPLLFLSRSEMAIVDIIAIVSMTVKIIRVLRLSLNHYTFIFHS